MSAGDDDPRKIAVLLLCCEHVSLWDWKWKWLLSYMTCQVDKLVAAVKQALRGKRQVIFGITTSVTFMWTQERAGALVGLSDLQLSARIILLQVFYCAQARTQVMSFIYFFWFDTSYRVWFAVLALLERIASFVRHFLAQIINLLAEPMIPMANLCAKSGYF